jgi:hypothetical protein
MNKKVNQSFRRYDRKNENYLKDFFNNSSTSLSDNTLTNFCLLSLNSLDQIGALLKAKDIANNGASFLCGDIFLASSKNCSYTDIGITLTNLSKSLMNCSNSFSFNLANFIKSLLISNNSSFENSGIIGFILSFQSCLNNFLTLPFTTKENNTFVSMIKKIYNNPCLLAIPSLSFSPSANACFSVNLDLDAVFSNLLNAASNSNLSFKEISTPLAIISGKSFSKLIFLTSLLASLSTSSGISNSIFILILCYTNFIKLLSYSKDLNVFNKYPLEAIREAIINAVCHRDYTEASDIQIRIYDDRLIVWNPGKLPIGITIEDLYKTHKSVLRNRLIAQIFFDIGLIEKWGTGIQRIIDSCQKQNLPIPIFEEYQGFRVIFRKPYAKEELEKLGLNERQIKAVEYIEKIGSITNREYQKLTLVSRMTATRDLTDLVKKGILRTVGAGKRDFKYVLVLHHHDAKMMQKNRGVDL